MAHKIIAADLGASGIKLVRFEAGFRKSFLVDARVIPVDASEGAYARPEERIPAQLEAIAREIREQRYAAEELTLALSGDALTFRVLDLPFSSPRQIESVLPYELESSLLQPVDELILDFVPVSTRSGEGAETRVLVAAVPKTLVELIVRGALERGLPLKSITAAPLALAHFAGVEAGPDPVMVVDLGAEQTTLCVSRAGVAQSARTVIRGARHLRDAVAAAFQLPPDRAAEALVASGFVAHPGVVGMTPAQLHMDRAIRDALRPLVRELRQTLAAHRAQYGAAHGGQSGAPIARLLLTGGGANLPGLPEFLAEELALPAERLAWPPREGFAAPALGAPERYSVAAGVAAAQMAQAPLIDLRKGEFAFRSDYSFLRAKAPQIAAGLVAVLCFAGLNAYASLRGLRKDNELLTTKLKLATKEIFGQERVDARAVSEDIQGGPKGNGPVPFPSMTAYDLLDEIAHLAPPNDKIRLDIIDLDIKPKKTTIKGTAETAQQVDDLVASLKQIECFEDVQAGKITNTTINVPCDADKDHPGTPSPTTGPGGAAKDAKDGKDTKGPGDRKCGAMELKQFNITVKSSCP